MPKKKKQLYIILKSLLVLILIDIGLIVIGSRTLLNFPMHKKNSSKNNRKLNLKMNKRLKMKK